MDLAAFFDEIFQVLDAAGIGLVVPVDGPGVHGDVPAPYTQLPDITYCEPGPGLHRIPDLGLMVVFGPANNATVFRLALEYASPAGAKSVRQALEAHTWVTVGTVFVKSAEPSTEILRGANPALAYTFHIDVTGA